MVKKKAIIIVAILVLLILILNYKPFQEKEIFYYDYVKNINITFEPQELNSELDNSLFKKKLNILLVGVDERNRESEPSRSDAMVLLNSDLKKDNYIMLSIPRDTYVSGVHSNKLTATHLVGGPALTIKKVKELLGIPIHHYIEINFNGFEGIVDALGGIDINVSRSITDERYPTPDDKGTMTIHIPAGMQHMNGTVALQYVRTRHDSVGLFDRARQQQNFLTILLNQSLKPKNIFKMPAIYKSLKPNLYSDMSVIEMMNLALLLKRSGPSKKLILSGKSKMIYNDYYKKKLWYSIPDPEEKDKIITLLKN